MEWYNRKSLRSYKNDITEEVIDYITSYINNGWDDIAMVLVGFIVLMIIMLLVDFILKKSILFFTRKLMHLTRLKWSIAFYRNRVYNSIIHYASIGISRAFMPYIFYHMPGMVGFMDRLFYIMIIVVFIQMFNRVAESISDISVDENNYRTVAVRSFSQLVKIITVFFGVLGIISILFNVEYNKILGTLGALTAILLLVFRDTILGFVSGVQIASTRMIKVGDWISVPKYQIEGTIREINLISAKILNFDKTISSIPTYDLITTEVKNFEPMVNTNTRRIKRSILFNIKSFKFCTPEMLEKFKQIDLIKDYITTRQAELKEYNKAKGYNPDNIVNGINLTNIGVFREYTKRYLAENPNISKGPDDYILVRQLEAKPQGLPLEIFCFANTSVWLEFEKVQADVFDHLLTACKEFELEVVQVLAT